MSCLEISDRLWERVAPLLEPFKRRRPGGSKPLGFWTVMDGILYVLKTGCQWNCLPPCYGSKSAVHEHFQRWAAAGVFAEMFRWSAADYEELEGFELAWQSMDGSLVQAPVRQAHHRQDEGLGRNPTDRGRSGGKVHLQVDGKGMPFAVVQVGANVHDSRLVTVTVEAAVITAPADARQGPRHLCLDKGYGYGRVEREVTGLGYRSPHPQDRRGKTPRLRGNAPRSAVGCGADIRLAQGLPGHPNPLHLPWSQLLGPPSIRLCPNP